MQVRISSCARICWRRGSCPGSETPPPRCSQFPPNYHARFIADLRADLLSSGVPPAEAAGVASHAFRHGAALDIHDADGFAAACARAEWKSAAVTAYIPPSRIESRALAEALCEASEAEL